MIRNKLKYLVDLVINAWELISCGVGSGFMFTLLSCAWSGVADAASIPDSRLMLCFVVGGLFGVVSTFWEDLL